MTIQEAINYLLYLEQQNKERENLEKILDKIQKIINERTNEC